MWTVLSSVKEAMYEPIEVWLPKHLIKEGISQYVQGVEVHDFMDAIRIIILKNLLLLFTDISVLAPMG